MRGLWVCPGLLAVIAVVGCGPSSQEQARREAIRRAGEEVYVASVCGACHGARRQGGPSGPPLRSLARHWTEDALVTFLRNPPATIQASPRLRELSSRYPGHMAGLPMASEDTLRTLARSLLLD